MNDSASHFTQSTYVQAVISAGIMATSLSPSMAANQQATDWKATQYENTAYSMNQVQSSHGSEQVYLQRKGALSEAQFSSEISALYAELLQAQKSLPEDLAAYLDEHALDLYAS
ncbi:hypothetical protein D1224_03385 [Henriciella barbarensis]|uniref:Uncharacterized protein n=1 Tax=Henriciella barbarensis TaxID=86342 RepID=A0A399QX13_9PROT|nr:hypothetical protein [Henriciella barbarensis]RIJ23333.1 hypothetical protein D1224_03385 [Henriciella barbarensis]